MNSDVQMWILFFYEKQTILWSAKHWWLFHMFYPNKLEFSKIIFSFSLRVSNLHLQIVFQHFVISLSVITKLTERPRYSKLLPCARTLLIGSMNLGTSVWNLFCPRPVPFYGPLRPTENFSKQSQCSILVKHFRFMSSQQWTFHERRYFI